MPSGPIIICAVGADICPADVLRAPRLYETSIAPTANAPPTAPTAVLMVSSCVARRTAHTRPRWRIHQAECQQFYWEIRTYTGRDVLNAPQIVRFSEQSVNGVNVLSRIAALRPASALRPAVMGKSSRENR